MRSLKAMALLLFAGVAVRPAAAMELGVYTGAGCTGTAGLQQFNAWLGRPVSRGLDFFAIAQTWGDVINEANWVIYCWKSAHLPVKMTFSVPMLPTGSTFNFKQGMDGAYDKFFTQIGKALVANGFANANLRIGWEFNGTWYPWSAQRNPTNWVAYYRRIVTTFRAVEGSHFTFDWNPTLGTVSLAPKEVYPGDEYVDYIGMDIYDQYWGPNGSIVKSPQTRWNDYLTEDYGMNWLRDFAELHQKKISVPEWGVEYRTDGHGGGDDPFFIQKMAAWFTAQNVAYSDYFDFNMQGTNYKISGKQFPESAAAFKAAFGPQ